MRDVFLLLTIQQPAANASWRGNLAPTTRVVSS